MVAFLKSLGVVFGLLFVTLVLSVISPEVGFYVGVALIIIPIIAIIKPMPKLWLGHRAFSITVLLFIGLPSTMSNQDTLAKKTEVHLVLQIT